MEPRRGELPGHRLQQRLADAFLLSAAVWVVLCILAGAPMTHGLEVHDCEADSSTYEVVDLLETGECPTMDTRFQVPEDQQMQVLFEEPEKSIKGFRCRAVESRMVVSCNKWNHQAHGIHFPIWRQPIRLTADRCRQIIRDRLY